ncbi:MAG TPA: tungsten ABC transporter substrate-binding protein [Cyanobacteria bacterium UBA8530]|nr:tungsten ABC transporter substrate-binding protein [Cyanobacteria bacterium UBA8530]
MKKKRLLCSLISLFSLFSLPSLADSYRVSWVNWKALAEGAPKTLILATTTSVQDSGLLDVLLPIFEHRVDIKVKTVAVGSGQAMALGQKGEADVMLVHSPKAEEKFMKEGYGIERKLLMHNAFMIAGPKSDPAGVRGCKTAKEALLKISNSSSLFVSRGDESGTHAREKSLWAAAGVSPEKKSWYQSTGSGMGATLNIASEKASYVLTDRATFLALRKNLALVPLVEGDPALLNLYHVILVNPKKFPEVNAVGARAFSLFLTSPETRKVIEKYGVERFGEPLFVPDTAK